MKFSANLLNSKSENISYSLSGSSKLSLNLLESKSTGTSVIIVASFFESNPASLLASIFSRSLPLILSVFDNKFSILPYSLRNFLAVLSPTPGSPGILSTESPFIARKSITCIGSDISNLLFTSSIPHVSYPPPNKGLYIKVFLLTN